MRQTMPALPVKSNDLKEDNTVLNIAPFIARLKYHASYKVLAIIFKTKKRVNINMLVSLYAFVLKKCTVYK